MSKLHLSRTLNLENEQEVALCITDAIDELAKAQVIMQLVGNSYKLVCSSQGLPLIHVGDLFIRLESQSSAVNL